MKIRATGLLGLLVASLGACHADDPAGPHAARLAASFPAHAAEILEGEARFARTPDDRALPRPRGALQAVLPARGEDPLVLTTGDGFAVTVREAGLSGEPAPAGAATAYARAGAGGVSFWRASGDGGDVRAGRAGFEEWLLLGAAEAAASPAASWEITGGALERQGDAVAIVDAAGLPRLLVTAPRAYAASGRAVGVRLAVRGNHLDLSLDGLPPGEEALVDPAWTATPLMTTARWSHTATLLKDGRVLVAGGNPAEASTTAEIYDPVNVSWTPTAKPMPEPHNTHVAALLCDGRVLIAGGFSGSVGASPLTSIYDPVADTWTKAAPMHYGHTYGTATLLEPSCQVLVVGGYTALNVAELYDPVAGTWTVLPSTLSQTRFYGTATTLADGRVLVAGGGYDQNLVWSSLPNVDVYDPTTQKWSLLPFLHFPRRSHSAVLLPDGRVLVAGGSVGGEDDGAQAAVELDSAEIYDPTTKAWTVAPSLAGKRTTHSATVLGNGAVLIAGGIDDTGSSLRSAEVWSGEKFSPAPSMSQNRYLHTATLLDDGAVLLAGGEHQATAELYRVDQDGAPCTGASDCASGFCVDGVCCDTACADPCSACNASDALGTCASPCTDATHARTCPGGGPCSTAAQCAAESCSPFLCTAAARGCATTCTTVADCAPGFACDQDHQCVPPPGMVDGDPGACSLPAGAQGSGAGLLALVAAAAAARRRRRRQGESLSCSAARSPISSRSAAVERPAAARARS